MGRSLLHSRRERDIGEHLTKAVRAVMRQNPALAGVIDFVDFASERNGERDINPAKLAAVIETFSDPRYRLGLADVQADFLGRAYEYLLRKFAEDERREVMRERVASWARRLNVQPRQVRVQCMTRKWARVRPQVLSPLPPTSPIRT